MNCNCDDKTPSIFKNDDTGAFRLGEDEYFLKINRPHGIADEIGIYKVEFKCGTLPIMTFGDGETEITFPIGINLTADQTKVLDTYNNCYMKCYDINGLGQTCTGTIAFKANKQVV